MKTAWVTVEIGGRRQQARALIDDGATTSFITSRLANSLRAKKIHSSTHCSGLQQTALATSKYKDALTLHSSPGFPKRSVDIVAAVLDRITYDSPRVAISGIRQHSLLSDLTLADPDFNQPGRIDLLLGIGAFSRILLDGVRISEKEELFTQKTIFGWLVGGRLEFPAQVAQIHLCLNSNSLDEQTNQLMRAFWEVEEIPADISTLSADDYSAMEQFKASISRKPTGRYVVRLPRRDPAPPLGCSRDQAARRLQQNRTDVLYLTRDNGASSKELSKNMPTSTMLNSYHLKTWSRRRQRPTTSQCMASRRRQAPPQS